MALFSIPGLQLKAVSAAVPVHEVCNEDLDLLNDPHGRGFVQAIGIKTRRVAPPAICASDLCVAAAQHILEQLCLRPAAIGLVVFVTQTPDYPLPGNSMLAQHRLGLPSSTYLVDLNQGCAGYVYGLASLASLMNATHIDRGLLLVGDTITRVLSSQDRGTFPIFSDAGSATLLEQAPQAQAMHFNLGSEGKGADIIQVRGGGARQPFGTNGFVVDADEPNGACAPIHLTMRGLDVLHYSLKYVSSSIQELLAFANCTLENPDYYVFHQANRILNETLLKKLGISSDRAPESLFEYGNTSSATIPVTICHRLGEVLDHGSKKLLLSGFGAGFSWGSALINVDSILCPKLLEISEPHATQA